MLTRLRKILAYKSRNMAILQAMKERQEARLRVVRAIDNTIASLNGENNWGLKVECGYRQVEGEQ